MTNDSLGPWMRSNSIIGSSPLRRFALITCLACNRLGRGREDNNEAYVAIELCEGSNGLPQITSTPPTLGLVGVPYVYDLSATDPENQPLTYGLLVAPDGMMIDQATGAVTWIPTNLQLGTHPVSLEVDDGLGGKDVQSYVVTVSFVSGELPSDDVDADGDGSPAGQDCDDSKPGN